MRIQKSLTHFLVTSLFLLVSFSSHAFEDQPSKQILDNGLTVLVTEIPSSPVVSVYALIKTGSATEGKFLGTGISHFLEHMLFKGTHGRDVGDLKLAAGPVQLRRLVCQPQPRHEPLEHRGGTLRQFLVTNQRVIDR